MSRSYVHGIAGRWALGAVALTISALALRGVPGWWMILQESRDDAYAAVRSVNDAHAILEAAPSMRDSLRARREAYTDELSSLISAVSPAEAASHLSGVVSQFASNAGVALSSLTLVADSTAPLGFGRPRVRAEARGDISGLTQLLLLLESGHSHLRTVELVVSQSDPVGGERPEELRFSITVEGLAKMRMGVQLGGAE